MTQALYAHMNNKTIKKKGSVLSLTDELKTASFYRTDNHSTLGAHGFTMENYILSLPHPQPGHYSSLARQK
jgi:hypothetical protein